MKAKFIMMLALQAEAQGYRTLQRELEGVALSVQHRNTTPAVMLLEQYIRVAEKSVKPEGYEMNDYWKLHLVVYKTVLALLRGEL